jgi:hypothetical protein
MTRYLLAAAVLAALFATAGHAQEFRRYEIGYLPISYARIDGADLAGGELSFVVNINEKVAIVSALDVHADLDLTELRYTTYRAGVRSTPLRTSRLRGFIETTFGGLRITFPFVEGVNGISLTGGVGLDVTIRPWIAWRAAKVDYSAVRAAGSSADGVRLGTGVVFRFGGE